MSVIKTKGIVLKQINMNDNDRLFTMFCPGTGKLSAMSKGIRSHKHKDFAALQPFCYCDFVIDTGRGLGYITSAEMLENFFGLRSSVEKMSLAAYITDLVSAISDEIIYDDDFFKFILNTLFVISRIDESKTESLSSELLRLKAVFELKTVSTAGYMPETRACICCNSTKELSYFDLYNGGAVCKACGDSGRLPELFEASQAAVGMIDYICSADSRSVFSFSASCENIIAVNNISENYLINKFEIVSAQLEYFKNIINS